MIYFVRTIEYFAQWRYLWIIGREVAEYCSQNFHKFLIDTDAYNEGSVKEALHQTFMAIDEAVTSDEVYIL